MIHSEPKTSIYQPILGQLNTYINFTKNAQDTISLKEGISKAAEETKMAFASEIKEMFRKGLYDSIVFLSLAYIKVNMDHAEKYYIEVISQLRLLGYDSIKAKDFKSLFEDFKDKETEVAFNRLSFVHPSYEDAFIRALTDDNTNPNVISIKLFSPILDKFIEKPEYAYRIASILEEAFDFISPESGLKILYILSQTNDPSAIDEIDRVLEANFYQIPLNELKATLINFSKNKLFGPGFISILFDNIFEFDDSLKKEILINLSLMDEEYSAAFVSKIVLENSAYISLQLINEIINNLLKNNATLSSATWIMIHSYERDPSYYRRLLMDLSNADETSWAVSYELGAGINKIPLDLSTELLIKLSQKISSAREAACITYLLFDRMERDKLKEILINLDQMSDPMDHITKLIAKSIFLNNMYMFTSGDKEYLKEKFFDKKITPEIIDMYEEIYDNIKVEIASKWPEQFHILKFAFPEKLMLIPRKLESTY